MCIRDRFTGSGEGQETVYTTLPGNTSTLVGDQGKAAKSSEFWKSIAPIQRTSRDVSESENLAGRPQVDLFYISTLCLKKVLTF